MTHKPSLRKREIQTDSGRAFLDDPSAPLESWVLSIEADMERLTEDRIIATFCTCGPDRHRPTWKHCAAYDLARRIEATREP